MSEIADAPEDVPRGRGATEISDDHRQASDYQRPAQKATSSIADEYAASCCNIDGDRLAELQAAGIQLHGRDGQQIVGRLPIETYADGLYEPRDDGPAAVICPVGTWDSLNWRLDDLVAFYLAQPSRWWLRRDVATVLGDPHAFSIEPRRLAANPLGWLQGGGRGLCLLDTPEPPSSR